MAKRRLVRFVWILALLTSASILPSCGGSGSSGTGGGGGQMQAPPAPTGLTATAGNQQVALSWSASSGATSYNVKRATVTGGPYAQVVNVTQTSDTDTGLTNGTPYYYVVTALNAGGESANSTQASATPVAPSTSVQATINVLTNRHTISPYIYGGAFPTDASTITDSGLPVVRWGGNAASTYNWQLGTDNADNDYYFEDFGFSALNNAADSNSTQFITDVKAAGSAPLMTMVMLPWVAQTAETAGSSGNLHWTYPQTEYPNQCSFDQYNSDAGNGIVSGTCTNSNPTYVLATPADLNRTYFPLLDQPGTSDPANSVYRNQWAAAMATAFGSSPHFYDMDNEIDIWGGTHHDVHPNGSGYDELRDTYLTEAGNLKTWDPAAIRFGPVSCCWYFYWNLPSTTDNKSTHAGIDFLPWWLNDVAWSDAAAGTRSLDVFDIHAYPDADTSGLSTSQLQALAAKIYRDWWDPTFPSAAAYVVNGGFSIEPVASNPFRIPRMRAMMNAIYPGTQFSMTEWSAAFAGESDFSTAIGDADAYGVLGRERVYLSTRWEAPASANPNYQALKLYTNYDGNHHGFGTTSVSASHNADPNLFSIYSALNSTGTTMTIMVLNKDPNNSAQVSFTTTGFTPTSETTYTLSPPPAPASIVASSSQSWSSTQTFAPYTATMLVVSGSLSSTPASEWDLNPDTIMVAAGGTVTLAPKIVSGTANVTMQTAVADAYEGASACTGMSVNLTTATITPSTPGEITVTAGNTPAFCHFSVTASDGTVTQTQGGWIVVGNPPATLAKTSGDAQTGTVGTTLPTGLTVTLSPGPSGGTNVGASVLFTTSAGTLTYNSVTGSKVIAVTDSSGIASVTLTLPSTAQTVTVTAEGPYGLGHPVAPSFTETAQ